ncbi:DUF4384 domain-containing protein [bacterium]|nr:DUF4384 domain-containing protein [bacterium]MBP9810215.1 DUF4384 domain-containing protein [bacterium]
MKALELIRKSCAVSLAVALGVVISTGVYAQEQSGAKGLFFEQLEKPTESLNTGLRYWIELKRGNNVTRVSNKFQFKTNDSIRFHVRSNIDGYAYILLSSGSRGEQSVLFPDNRAAENNKVDRGKDYALPSDGYLTFDENPGLEKLTLLLSRSPMDAQAYLQKPQKEVTMIASAQTGSKDLVPARIYVSYNAPRVEAPVFLPATTPSKPEKVTKVEKTEKIAKVTHPKLTQAAKSEHPERTSQAAAVDDKPKAAHRPVKVKRAVGSSSSGSASNHASGTSSSPKEEEGTVTVVSQQSSGVLHVDVALQHI